MAARIEYGYRYQGQDTWNSHEDLDQLKRLCKKYELTLIAREVSEPRVVSLRD